MLGPKLLRKRPSEIEDSDSSDSDIDVSPIKRRKCDDERSMFHSYFLHFSQSLSTRLKEVWHRMFRFPLKSYLEIAMYKFVEVPSPEVVDVDDDCAAEENEENDIAVIEATKMSSAFPERHKNAHRNIKSRNYSFSSRQPLASTPFGDNCRPTCDEYSILSSSPLQRKPLVGYISRYSHSDGDRPLQNGTRSQNLAPFSDISPKDIVVLDQDSEDGDSDLKILAEIHPFPKTTSPMRKAYRRGYKFGHSFDSDASQDSVNSARSHSSLSRSSSYTAHEVVRIHEKEQYKLLLDKMVNRASYNFGAPRTQTKCANVQVDLTENGDRNEEPLIVGPHFKKEVLQKPAREFLKKYYKPCQLITKVSSHEEGGDSDVEIIEEKISELRSSKPQSLYSSEWIQELKSTIASDTEKMKKIVAQKEKQSSYYKKRRDEKLAEEKRQLDLMRLSGAIVSDLDVEDDEFRDLTEEQQQMVNNIFRNPPTFRHAKSALLTSDFTTLKGLNWLNDEIINRYLDLIVERNNSAKSQSPSTPTIFLVSSFFYVNIKNRGLDSVKRWTRNVDIFSYDLMLIPIHLQMHWALMVVDNRAKTIKYYDSMSSTNEECLHVVRNYLIFEMEFRKKIKMNPNEYSIEKVANIPKQENGSDCGMFTLKYAEYVARDKPFTFSQEHMPLFRRRMMYELLTKQLF